jgi:hypothetical protein
MILLSSAIEIGVAAVENLLAQRLADSPWIGGMPVCGDALQRRPYYR